MKQIASRPAVQPVLQAAILLLASWLRWPWPASGWPHVDEHIFIERTLGFWSGDLHPHFFNYPTLQLYLVSAVQYLYYLLCSSVSLEEFIAYRYFVDGTDILTIARALTTLMAVATVAVTIRIGTRLYGPCGGLSAGLLLALYPLHMRFSHLATTDVPAVFWLSLALLYAVCIVQEGRRRDHLLAGLAAGLAAATKYPAALICLPIAIASLHRPKKYLALSGTAAIGGFALATPYVLLDFTAFWHDFAGMGREHLLGTTRTSQEQPGPYLLQYSLRYGIGLIGLLGVLFAAIYRPRTWRRDEALILAGFATFLGLVLFAESVFMRYALPLVPFTALLCVRLLTPRSPRVWAIGLLLLSLEPLYLSQQMHSLMGHTDTRTQITAHIQRQSPLGQRIFSTPSGLTPFIHHHSVIGREQAYKQSFSTTDLIQAYALLAHRADLPPTYGFWAEAPLVDQLATGATAIDSAWVLSYSHPLLTPDANPPHAILAHTQWHKTFSPGTTAGMIFDRVDRYFTPIGGFADATRPGPTIALGKVGLTQTPSPLPSSQTFFAILHRLRQADLAIAEEDWQQVVQANTHLILQITYLRQLIPPAYLSKLCNDLGTAWDQLGDPKRAKHYRDQAQQLLN